METPVNAQRTFSYIDCTAYIELKTISKIRAIFIQVSTFLDLLHKLFLAFSGTFGGGELFPVSVQRVTHRLHG